MLLNNSSAIEVSPTFNPSLVWYQAHRHLECHPSDDLRAHRIYARYSGEWSVANSLCHEPCRVNSYPTPGLAPFEIRLLHILLGQQAEEIHCQLSVAFLPSRPSYQALSYVCGSPKAIRPICVNGYKHFNYCTSGMCITKDPSRWYDSCTLGGRHLHRSTRP